MIIARRDHYCIEHEIPFIQIVGIWGVNVFACFKCVYARRALAKAGKE
jgi:hypothetical protein